MMMVKTVIVVINSERGLIKMMWVLLVIRVVWWFKGDWGFVGSEVIAITWSVKSVRFEVFILVHDRRKLSVGVLILESVVRRKILLSILGFRSLSLYMKDNVKRIIVSSILR